MVPGKTGVNKEAATMTLPNPIEVPDPNIDEPALPEPIPDQDPPSTPPPNETPVGDPPANARRTLPGN